MKHDVALVSAVSTPAISRLLTQFFFTSQSMKTCDHTVATTLSSRQCPQSLHSRPNIRLYWYRQLTGNHRWHIAVEWRISIRVWRMLETMETFHWNGQFEKPFKGQFWIWGLWKRQLSSRATHWMIRQRRPCWKLLASRKPRRIERLRHCVVCWPTYPRLVPIPTECYLMGLTK